MSAIVQDRKTKSKRASFWLAGVLTIPALLGLIVIFILAYNQEVASMETTSKTLTFIGVAGGAILVMVIGLTIWSFVNKFWLAWYFVVLSFIVMWIVFKPLTWLLLLIAVSMGWLY